MPKRNFLQDVTYSITNSYVEISKRILGYDRPNLPRHLMERSRLLLSILFAVGFVVFYQQSRDLSAIVRWFGLASIFCSFMFFFLFDVVTKRR